MHTVQGALPLASGVQTQAAATIAPHPVVPGRGRARVLALPPPATECAFYSCSPAKPACRLRTMEELVSAATGQEDWHKLPRWKRVPSMDAGERISVEPSSSLRGAVAPRRTLAARAHVACTRGIVLGCAEGGTWCQGGGAAGLPPRGEACAAAGHLRTASQPSPADPPCHPHSCSHPLAARPGHAPCHLLHL